MLVLFNFSFIKEDNKYSDFESIDFSNVVGVKVDVRLIFKVLFRVQNLVQKI